MKLPTDSEVKDLFGAFTKQPKEETEAEKAMRKIKELNERLQTYGK